MTTSQTAARLLQAAATLIETEGWQQGDLGNPIDGWCTIGAIQRAYAITAIRTDGILTTDDIDDAIKAVVVTTNDNEATTRIAAWNDHPGRTSSEVTRVLRQTAATLTKDHQ